MFFVLQEPWLRVWEWLPVDTRLSKGTLSGDKMLAINYKREILFSKRRTILTKYSRNFSLVILKKNDCLMALLSFFFNHYFATNAFLRDKVCSIRCIFSLGTYLFRTLCALYVVHSCFYWASRTLLLQSWKRSIPKSFYILIWCSQNLQRGLSFYRLTYKWIIHEYNPGKSLLCRKVVFVSYFIKNYELFLIKDILADVL